jgi:hypothetical protein
MEQLQAALSPSAEPTAGDDVSRQTGETLRIHRALHALPKARTHGVGLLQPGFAPSGLDPRQRKTEPERE